MRRLTKGPKPRVLERNAERWTAQLMAADTKAKRDRAVAKYRNPSIRTALEEETLRKCAYCESRLGVTATGDIEHVVPKAPQPERAFEWANMTLACPLCNQNKSDHWDPDFPLLDPYTDDLGAHLYACGPLIVRWFGDIRGEKTVSLLDLNRSGLQERRLERMQRLERLVRLCQEANSPAERAALREQLDLELGADREYTMTVTAFVHQHLGPNQHVGEAVDREQRESD